MNEINAKYQSHGGATGFLGEKTDEESSCPDRKGRFNHYRQGSIHWHPDLGAFETHGAICNKWKDLGWEQGSLGYPISDEQDWYANQLWEMLPNPPFATVVPGEEIGNRFFEQLVPQKDSNIGRRSLFQHGCITWWKKAPPLLGETWAWKKTGDGKYVPISPPSEKSASHDKYPKIAEKVKFWEEQDKINQLIIPRVTEPYAYPADSGLGKF